MKESKFKLTREQLITLSNIVGYGSSHISERSYEYLLVASILHKIYEAIEIKLLKTVKPKYTITFNTHQSLALLIYCNLIIDDINISSYSGILVHNIRTELLRIFRL